MVNVAFPFQTQLTCSYLTNFADIAFFIHATTTFVFVRSLLHFTCCWFLNNFFFISVTRAIEVFIVQEINSHLSTAQNQNSIKFHQNDFMIAMSKVTLWFSAHFGLNEFFFFDFEILANQFRNWASQIGSDARSCMRTKKTESQRGEIKYETT